MHKILAVGWKILYSPSRHTRSEAIIITLVVVLVISTHRKVPSTSNLEPTSQFLSMLRIFSVVFKARLVQLSIKDCTSTLKIFSFPREMCTLSLI